jgi:hypothetical protein
VALVVPGALGAAGVSAIAVDAPLIAGGLGAGLALLLLPWAPLFFLLVAFATIQNPSLGPIAGVQIAGLSFRPAMLVLVPFALRSYLQTKPEHRNRWGAPELMLLGWWLLQPITSHYNSPSFKQSLPAMGLLTMGVIAYFTVHASVSTSKRLIFATRVLLGWVLVNASLGVLAAAAHFTVGTNFGISTKSAFGSGVFGLSYEHDIFASTCGVGAIMCYSLWRERNPVAFPRLCGWGFWICLIGMFLGLARAAWVSFILTFIFAVFYTRKGVRRPRRAERLAIGLMCFTILLLLGSYVFLSTDTTTAGQEGGNTLSAIKGKTEQLFNTSSGTGKGRLTEFRTALSDLAQSPIVGLGTNSYSQRHQIQKNTNFIGDLWLRELYDSGLIGLLLFAGAIALILWPNRALRYSRTEAAPVARALTFGWISLIVSYAGTDATLYLWPWILLALVRAARVLSQRPQRAIAPPPLVPATASGNGYAGTGRPLPDGSHVSRRPSRPGPRR